MKESRANVGDFIPVVELVIFYLLNPEDYLGFFGLFHLTIG